ncbi:phosphoribosylanthranilate isomerase [Bacillus marasmi]|uniref:phosphoribosylanthranilate isomerase n=1 Tax=Bacillus marasmi TaxID=1926279 RepID=UPI0011C805CD|nr:phosphoribosylanthranilate isomerase [Bacillus marasmi]
MKVKICGITDVETALQAVAFGADAIGFVFAESKRKISPASAGLIAEQLPAYVEKIGVFVNETSDRIQEIIEEAKLTMIQLHGDETPEFCKDFSVPVIKAFSIGCQQDLEQIEDYPNQWFLLDSPSGKYRGGNGITFNWELLSSNTLPNKRIILAGGLNIDNVANAIEIAKPEMVDVSSGVETDGKKDTHKIKAFIQKAKKNND